MRVAGLYRYPLKSAAAESLRATDLEARGLAHDRRWMLVDEQGRFITGRTAPRLVLLQAEQQVTGKPKLEKKKRSRRKDLWTDKAAAKIAELRMAEKMGAERAVSVFSLVFLHPHHSSLRHAQEL